MTCSVSITLLCKSRQSYLTNIINGDINTYAVFPPTQLALEFILAKRCNECACFFP